MHARSLCTILVAIASPLYCLAIEQNTSILSQPHSSQSTPILSSSIAHIHHHHHTHKRNDNLYATSTLQQVVTGTPSLHKRATTTAAKLIQRDDSLPTLSAESSSYSYKIEVPSAEKSAKYDANPYILRVTLPENLVFIIVGAIIALLIVSLVVYRMASYVVHNRIAKTDREYYYSNFSLFGSGSNGGSGSGSSSSNSLFNGMSSSNSSMWEKNSSYFNSNSSIYLLNKQNQMTSEHLDDNSSSSQQGRTYRSTINNANLGAGNRGSMFISPVLDVMGSQGAGNRGSMYISPVLDIMSQANRKSQSNLELPLYHKSMTDLTNPALQQNTTTPMALNEGADSLTYGVGNGYDTPTMQQSPSMYAGSNDVLLDKYQSSPHIKPPAMKRPPSQFLDDLINDTDSIEL